MSSSTFIEETSDDKDDQLIIIVNADGTITVDEETLKKLIANQHHAGNLSVIRVGDGAQEEGDSEGHHVNLTVEGYYSGNDETATAGAASSDTSNEVVDPFAVMEPEHLARLESVLQSEQAKEILGSHLDDNLNPVLDILDNKDEASRTALHNDHSYTTTLPAHQQNPVSTQQQSVQPQNQPLTMHRPLTRGGRGRGRGRVLTRGGSRGAGHPQVVTVSSSPVVIQPNVAPKVIQASPQKTYLISQSGRRVVNQPTILTPVQPPSIVEEVVEEAPTIPIPQTPPQSVSDPSTPRFTRIIQKKLISPKGVQQPSTPGQPQLKQQTLHQVLLASPQATSTPTPISSRVIMPENGKTSTVVSATSPKTIIVPKKVVTVRGGGRVSGRGLRGRGGRTRQQSLTTLPPSQPTPGPSSEEVSDALQAMEISPPPQPPPAQPTITSPEPTLTSPQSTLTPPQPAQPPQQVTTPDPKAEPADVPESPTARRRTPTVIIRTVGSRAEIVPQLSTKSPKSRKHEDLVEQFAPPLPQQQSSVKAAKQASTPKTPDVPTSARVQAKEAPPTPAPEETAVKKKKEKKSVVTPVIVEGPELFSTPDIIRRVSTDKPAPSDPPPAPQLSPPPDTPQPTLKSPTENVEMTPESLLDSIHAEVAKDESNRLADALLLDDLTNDDSESMKSYTGNEKYVVSKSQSSPEESQTPPPERSLPAKKSDTSPISSAEMKVRKLPPIELPTTRSASKKAAATSSQEGSPLRQTVPEQQIQVQTPVSSKTGGHKERKKAARASTGTIQEKRHSNEGRRAVEKKHSINDDFVSDFEDEIESEPESVNSEDDPNRLWCICQKPHNNRFMICCDRCEDWFHGKCVGVTKAMGQQMEKDGTEWSCPNCRPQESKSSSSKLPPGQQTISSLMCEVCKAPARVGSNFCQDTCVKRHALNMIATLNEEVDGIQPSTRVIVYEKQTGTILSDESAPTVSNLAEWLLEHQTFQVHKLSINPKVYKKLISPQETTPPNRRQGRSLQAETNPPQTQLKQQQLTDIKKIQKPKEEIKQPQEQAKQDAPLSKQSQVQTKQAPSLSKQSHAQAKQESSQSKQSQVQIKKDASQSTQPQSQVKQDAPQSKQAPPSTPSKEIPQVPSKELVKPTKSQPTATPKQGGTEKVLRQTMLTSKVVGSTKEIGISSKPPAKIQIIQAQPLPPTPQPTKGKVKKEHSKKEEEEESKTKNKPSKPTAQPEAPKRSSIEVKRQSSDKPVTREDKRRDSISSKDAAEKDEKKKKEDKKKDKEKKKESVDNSQSEENNRTPISSTESVRDNVKQTLEKLLNQRVMQDESIKATNEEVKALAVSIEEEIFAFFKDIGAKYKAKYRSLLFNIKDPKNNLYKKIVEKLISPEQLVRLSPEELASQELAQWREKEAKHQIEIIKKNELDLIHQAKTVVLKSRKGEEVIESKVVNISEIESALNRTADDYEETENAIPSATKNDEDEKLLEKYLMEQKVKEERPSRSSERRKKSMADSENDKGEKKGDSSSSHSKKRTRSRSQEQDKEKSKRAKEKEKMVDKAVETLKEIEEVITSAQARVNCQHVLTPLINAEPGPSNEEQSSTDRVSTPPLEDLKPPIWQGYINMTEVSKLFTSAFQVSGNCDAFDEMLNSPQLDCVGRIQPDSVWTYVSKMKKSGTKDIIVIRFQADGHEEAMNYLSLYSYLNSRNRMGVISEHSTSESVKDFYILPLPSHSPIPQVLLPIDGPGFDEYRPHLLLGIIIRSKIPKKTNVVTASSSVERSYTPPLPDNGMESSYLDGDLPDSGSTTPPLPSFRTHSSNSSGYTPPLPEEHEPYSPGDGSSPDQIEEILVDPDIKKNLEVVNRMIAQKRQQIDSIKLAAVQGSACGDDDAPYSPSSSFTPPHDNIPFLEPNDVRLPPNLQDLLASIKGTPMIDRKVDPIVNAYKSQSLYYDDEEEMRDDDREVRSERTNRDPRQRPEPRTRKSSISQYSDSEHTRKMIDVENKHEPFKGPYYYPSQLPPPPPPPAPVAVLAPPLPIYGPGPPPPPTHFSYPPIVPPLPPPMVKDRKRKNKFKDRRPPPPPMPHPPRQKWDGGHHRGRMMTSHHNPMRGRQQRFRGGFDRGRGGNSFRGRGGFRPHRGGPRFDRPHNRDHHNDGSHSRDRSDRMGIKAEWDESIKMYEQKRARERKRKISRSPSPRRRSGTPPRRRSRRASSNSS